MAITISMFEFDFCTITPPCLTTAGNWADARLTRLWMSDATLSMSAPISKLAVSDIEPLEALDEVMYVIPSAPLICCSSGAATALATVSALAPGYTADTETEGGAICGYCAIGRFFIDTRPAKVMMIEMTAANIGRSIKKREIMEA